MSKEMVNVSAQIPRSLANKLEKVAKFYERPKSFFIRKALETFLEDSLSKIEKDKSKKNK